jgi:predicted ABC-type ATPase
MPEDQALTAILTRRPLLVVPAGPNGAGKTTFFNSFLSAQGLRFVNADNLARELEMGARQAAMAADALRVELIRQRESFITETVFSDHVGAKLAIFTSAMQQGTRSCCFISASAVPNAARSASLCA